jgi:hypothetical protein
MAMGNSSLIGLMTLGFLILIWGKGFWWVGVCLMLLSTVMAFGSGESPVVGPVGAAGRGQPAFAAPGKKEEELDIYDMKWSPTTLADGFVGNKMEDVYGPGAAIGSRSGAFTQDMGPIRFKDDFRFRITGEAGDFYKMCTDEVTGKALTAWDFRTRKDVFPGLHMGTVKTIESPDEMTNPGLGSPNEWARELQRRRDKQ